MAAVDFYQLDRSPLERVLPRLAERITAAGGRLLVVSADPGQLAQLDAALWSYAPDSFLPHGRAGEGGEADQPVLLSDRLEAANGAGVVALVDGRWRDEALGFGRALHFFDADGVDAARAAWRTLGGADVSRSFWKQVDGRWEKAA